jgi:O-antigen ligase
MAGLLARPALRDSVSGISPASDRHEMLVVLIVACLLAAVAQVAIALAERWAVRPSWAVVSRRAATAVTGAIVLALVVAVVILAASGTIDHLWHQFKEPNPPAATGNQYLRLLSLAGSHRYQYWQVAVSAYHTDTLKGIGPGTFEFYWAAHNTLREFVRNAHSLYLETLAELGLVGLALILGLVFFVIVAGGRQALTAERTADGREFRLIRATAVAGFAGFAAAAAFDWVWQLGVMPMIGMLCAAAAVGGGARRSTRDRHRRLLETRVILIAASLIGLWAVVIPYATTKAVRSSQSAAIRHDYRAALADAATAQTIEPEAASPALQRALVLEQLGDIAGASQAIGLAKAREPTNWQMWLVASRIATEAGQPRLALAYYRRARALNPTSPIFAQ